MADEENGRRPPARGQPQTVPVRVYESDGRLMVAAPLAGLEPQDITVTVDGDRVTIRGALRGPHQAEREHRAAEWAIGPYYREVTLPQPVHGALANATYGNGVLVLALPKVEPGRPGLGGGPAAFRLDAQGATRGAHIGHAGRDRHATTAAAHRQQMILAVRRAARGPAAETDMQDHERAEAAASRQKDREQDEVTTAAIDSFPASDAPSWTPATGEAAPDPPARPNRTTSTRRGHRGRTSPRPSPGTRAAGVAPATPSGDPRGPA